MDCKIIQTQLEDYCADRLDESQRAEVREHLAGCQDCRVQAIAFDPTLMFAAMSISETDHQRVERCADSVATMIRQDRLQRRLRSPRRTWLAAAAAVLVVLTGSVLWRTTAHGPVGSSATPTVGPVVAAATETAPPPRVEVEMGEENLRVYQFSDAGDENTAVYFIVNEAMEL